MIIPVFISGNGNQTSTNSTLQTELPHSNAKLASYTASNPISITSDSNFNTTAYAKGWPGNGSANNPFIIENLQIINNSANTVGIYINFVFSTYFIIRNNYIEMSGTSSIGIEISTAGTSLGIITNNTLYNNANYGVYVSGSDGNTVMNNTFDSNQIAGLYISANYNIINGNIFTNNYDGLSVSSSYNSSFYNNSFSKNSYYDFKIAGNFYQDNITNNNFDSNVNTMIYFASGSTYNVTFSNNEFLNGNLGLEFVTSLDNISIYSNYFYNNYEGIKITSTSVVNLLFYNNTFSSNTYGFFGNIGQNTVYNNTFSNNGYGLYLTSSSNGYITNNTFYGGTNVGIDIQNSNNNVIVNNDFNNIYIGVEIEDTSSSSNLIYANNFINSTVGNVPNASTTNKADNGSYGNFWLADFPLNCTISNNCPVDANHDGIADSAYYPPGTAVLIDHYPLMIWHNISLPLYLLTQYSNFTYDVEQPAYNLTWKILDESPSHYQIYRDSSLIQSGLWTSYKSLNATIPTIFGTYNYTFIANDSNGNVKTNMFFVTVADNTVPRINGSATYMSKESSPNQQINWNITDAYPDYYIVYKNSTIIDSNTWTAPSTITANITGLPLGTYNYTLVVNDTSNNINTFTTMVYVYDGTTPVVNNPGNQTFEAGSVASISWTAGDLHPADYKVYENGTLIGTGTWTSNTDITQILNTMALGTYNITIIIFDSSGNNVTNSIFVTIVDTTSPVVLSSSGNVSFSDTTTGHILSWNVADYFPSDYVMYVNDSIFSSNTWSAGTTSVNIDSLGLGYYNITMVFNDTSGNFVVYTTWISIVSDTTPPQVIQAPSNTSIEFGTYSNSVSWVAIDDFGPSTYVVLENGTISSSGTWSNNTLVTVNVVGLSLGLNNVTIIFYDTSNNSISSTIWITVYLKTVDTTAPVVVGSDFYRYELGTTGNELIINATDLHPYIFKLYINGTMKKTGNWTSSESIIVNLDSMNLSVGTYNFTFVVLDSFGNSANFKVSVSVYNNPSQITSIPTSTTSTSSKNMDSPLNVFMIFLSFGVLIWFKKYRN